jgi:uncharacterized protein (UPF0332 family)
LGPELGNEKLKKRKEIEKRIAKVSKQAVDITSNIQSGITIYEDFENVIDAISSANYNAKIIDAASVMSDEQLKLFFSDYGKHRLEII